MTKEFAPKGTYQNLAFIKRGAVGEVYRAVGKNGRTVAIKRLRPHLIYDRAELGRFHHEVQVLKKLNHTAFPKFIEVISEEAEEAYMVMEWLQGRPIEEAFENKIDPEKKEEGVAKFGLSMLEALKYLQNLNPPKGDSRGLIHCDLNPQNVLVGDDGLAKIFDFTHAVWIAEGAESKGGTWGYMALEQLEDKKVSIQTDLFAVGLLLFEALSGKPLIQGDNKFKIFLATIDLDLKKAINGVTQNLDLQNVLKMLLESIKIPSKNPTKEIISRLESLLGS